MPVVGGLNGATAMFCDSPQEATRQAPTLDSLAHWPGPAPRK
ncbi:hypothetical protein ACI2L4_41185 [Streptomyces sparsogenes]